MEKKEKTVEEKEENKVEGEIKEENNEVEQQPVKEKKPKKKKKRRIGRIISNIIFTLIVLVILLEAIVGIVNMKKLNDGEEPVWYLSTTKTEEENKVVTEYNLGLYRIIKTDTKIDSRIILKPFFIKD